VIGGVVIFGKSHMDKEKFGKVKELLFATSQPTTEPVDLATTKPTTDAADNLAVMVAKASGMPAQAQIEFIRQAFDAEQAELDRKRRELSDLQHQIDLARQQTKNDREKVIKAQNDLQDRPENAG